MQTKEYRVNLKEDANWEMHKLHFHEAVEITLVLSDGGEFFIDKEMYPLYKNTLVVLDANTLHRDMHVEGDALFRRYVFHILPGLLERLSTRQTNFAEVIRKAAKASPCIRLEQEDADRLAHWMVTAKNSKLTGFGADVRETGCLYEILLLVCGGIQNTRVETGADDPDYNKAEPILRYIRQVYREPFKLDDLAHHFLMNKHYLCHVFKKGTGFSVMEYVIQLRIIEAQSLLRSGCSVQEAGERAGFQTYEYFIRTFSKYVGVSPKQYAKRYHNSEQASVVLEHSVDQL